MKNILNNIWKRHQERKAESETFNGIWRDHYATMRAIDKKKYRSEGFMLGFLFAILFLVTIFHLIPAAL